MENSWQIQYFQGEWKRFTFADEVSIRRIFEGMKSMKSNRPVTCRMVNEIGMVVEEFLGAGAKVPVDQQGQSWAR